MPAMLSTGVFVCISWVLTLLPIVKGLSYNVTVDNTDPSITWVGNWRQTLPGFGMPVNGTYMTAKNDPSAYAEFTFTGVAVYFVCARWPYEVTTRITLDPESPNASPLLLDLSNYSASSTGANFGQALFLASATNLEYKEHTVRVDAGPNSRYAVFDAFVYSVPSPKGLPIVSSSASPVSDAFTPLPESLVTPYSPSSSASIPSVAPTPKKKLNLAAIIAPICAVAALLLIGAAYLLHRSRKSTNTMLFSQKAKLSDAESKGMESINDKVEGPSPGVVPATNIIYELQLPLSSH